MRLESLKLQNICTALRGEAVLDFERLPAGVYAFTGRNGSGKSHALEACLAG
jgi:DNA repair exonuclease SbcCD ATPase subunit